MTSRHLLIVNRKTIQSFLVLSRSPPLTSSSSFSLSMPPSLVREFPTRTTRLLSSQSLTGTDACTGTCTGTGTNNTQTKNSTAHASTGSARTGITNISASTGTHSSSSRSSSSSKPFRNLSSLPIVEDETHYEEEGGGIYHDHGVNTTDTDTDTDMDTNMCSSPSHLSYVADTSFPITSELKIVTPSDDAPSGIWPVYRIMDENGEFRNSNNDGYSFLQQQQQQQQQGGYSNHINQNHQTDHNDHNISQKVTATAEDYHNSTNHNNQQEEPNNNIYALQNKLSNQYPQHANMIHSSSLFQTKSNQNNKYKSYAETSSSITENQISNQNDRNCILLRAHRIMTRLRQMDDILLNAQRQGRISFYMTCYGEEGIHAGSASALTMDDVVLAQYREQGVLMWRGFTLEQFTNQCFANDLDLGRGRQMPIHYGSRALNYHTVSSPLGTQLPQAVGVAYKMKLDKLAKKTNTEANMEDSSSTPQKGDSITIVYFGEGAASTTDFHCALNFAATLKVPMIFFCRNNGYAISTKISDQYASDGIVCRSRGYGMAAIRVDGNDIFAVNAATKAAREYAIQNSEPVLIEAITYRQGHHSTSDDSYQYRSVEEVSKSENTYDPIMRFEKFLTKHKWINEDDLIAINDEERKSVLKAMERAEKRPQPKLGTMFQDVYKDMPLNLLMQEKSLHRHMKKYSEKY